MKLSKEFSQYLANLAIWTIKLHNLHWNVQGNRFVPIHEFTEAEYEKAFSRMDEVAEHFKMYEHIPPATLKEYMGIATIKEEPSRKFTCDEVLEILLKDMELMREDATKLRKACDQEDWFTAVSLFESHIDDYNKQIWFIKSTLSK